VRHSLFEKEQGEHFAPRSFAFFGPRNLLIFKPQHSTGYARMGWTGDCLDSAGIDQHRLSDRVGGRFSAGPQKITDALGCGGFGMVKPRRLLNRIGGFLLLGFIGDTMWPLLVGPGQMSSFCQTLALGSSREDIQGQVAKRGYRLRIDEKGAGPIFDPRSMGRFICHVEFIQGRLTTARYLHND
jgi:hypothetical protein